MNDSVEIKENLSSGMKFNKDELEELLKREESNKVELTVRIHRTSGSFVIIPSFGLSKIIGKFLLRIFSESSITSL